MMIDARDLFRMDLVILGMLVIGAVGLVLNLLLARIGRPSRGMEELI